MDERETSPNETPPRNQPAKNEPKTRPNRASCLKSPSENRAQNEPKTSPNRAQTRKLGRFGLDLASFWARFCFGGFGIWARFDLDLSSVLRTFEGCLGLVFLSFSSPWIFELRFLVFYHARLSPLPGSTLPQWRLFLYMFIGMVLPCRFQLLLPTFLGPRSGLGPFLSSRAASRCTSPETFDEVLQHLISRN